MNYPQPPADALPAVIAETLSLTPPSIFRDIALGLAGPGCQGPPQHQLFAARWAYDDLDPDVIGAYSETLDDTHWAALAAWSMFTRETNNMTRALNIAHRYRAALVIARRLKFSAAEAGHLVVSAFLTTIEMDV